MNSVILLLSPYRMPGDASMSNNYYLDVAMVAEQRGDRLQAAQTKLLLERAGVEQPGWVARQACRLVCGVGRMLVAVGERMICRASDSLAAPTAQRWMQSTIGR
jgi:hypothetical protein